jgi:diaminopimelate epimerase
MFLNTGSPHHVQLVDDLENYDVKQKEPIRYGDLYGQVGSNVNFVEQIEGITLSCEPMKALKMKHFLVERCQQQLQ